MPPMFYESSSTLPFIGSTSYYFMILSSCMSITLYVEHEIDDEIVINIDDVALEKMENTIEKKKQMAMIGPKKR
jgi:hypothetical protein